MRAESPPPSQPRITGDDIPEDIWHIIVSYLFQIKPRRIGPYMAVNRTFFNSILDRRYGKLWLISLDQRTLDRLERLQYAQTSHMTRIN